MEIVFCEGVQHRLQFCLDHLNCVKMVFLFLFSVGETEGWVGENHAVFGQKFPGEEGCERRCDVMVQPVLCRQSSGRILHTF
jgi:hypothetical protein